MSYLKNAINAKAAHVPYEWVGENLIYETVMGSVAYGANVDAATDYDIYGVTVPPLDWIFPSRRGLIPGFHKDTEKFWQYQQTAVMVGNVEYDFNIYNVVKYVRLCADGNPNMVDSLFTPSWCVKTETVLGWLLRHNRHLFISESLVRRTLGFATKEMKRLERNTATTPENVKRAKLVQEHGYDTKAAYHVLRLLLQAGQVLADGTLDLSKNGPTLLEVRKGRFPYPEMKRRLESEFARVESMLQSNTLIPERANEKLVGDLLWTVVEKAGAS